MKLSARKFSWFFVLALICFSVSSFAADSEKLTTAELLAKAKTATNSPLPVYNQPVTKATEPLKGTGPAPVAQGNSLQTSVTVDPIRHRCSDFVYEGDSARPAPGGSTGYRCHAGYDCHADGPSYECRWINSLAHDAVMYSDDPKCVYDDCDFLDSSHPLPSGGI